MHVLGATRLREGVLEVDEAKALFPDAKVTEDEDEIMFEVSKPGLGIGIDYDVEDKSLARVALYDDSDD